MSMATQKKKPAKKTTATSAAESQNPVLADFIKAAGDDKALLDIVQIIYDVEDAMNDFIKNEDIDFNLTGKERMRLIGAGVRNWGFINKAYEIARDNPDFLPKQFDALGFSRDMREYEEVRQLSFTLEQFLRAVNEAMLIRSDILFRLALRVYGNLRELARARVPGAQDLFNALLRYFRHRRRPGAAEPTEKEIERDLHSLLHNTADGKIVIENERPRASAGKRVLVDEVKRGRAAIKETEEAEIED